MEIRKITCKSGNEYQIVNESWETSNSWGHKSTLIARYGEVESHKIRYINRTWECYTYQSCMFGLIDKILTDNKKSYITEYKEKNGILRLTKAQKDVAIAEWSEREFVKDLLEIYDRINERNFN